MGLLLGGLATTGVSNSAAADSGTQVETSNPGETADGDNLLQFSSVGHVLGFSRDGVILASASHMLKTEFVNANAVAPEADQSSSGEAGDGAAPLSRVTYDNIWDDVTVIYEANEGVILKSTYYVSATEVGVPVDRIRLGYNRPVSIDENGNLVVAYENGTMVESAPVAWQEIEGERRPVAAAYALYGEREVGFSLGDYVPGVPVIIDPSLTWNTFLGGSGGNGGYAIAVDGSGNVYVTGESWATWGNPVRAYTGDADAFAAKLDSDGNLTWNTFLGGSGLDRGHAIAVDGSGNVYVTGESWATWDSPVRAYAGDEDAFAAKLDSSGNLTWHTFLGSSSHESGYGVAVDGDGNVYVTGESWATWDSPVRAYAGEADAFAARLGADGSLTWNTFLGSSRFESGHAIAVDASGNVYVTGCSLATWGSPVRAYTGGNDAFVVKLNSGGNLTWNTFLGSSSHELGFGVAVDGCGNVYVGGYSQATWGSPVRAYAGDADAFAAKLGADGTLTWNTFLGGSGGDYGRAIAVDGSGNVYVSGLSLAAWGSPVRAYAGDEDAFAAKLDSSGNLTWHTFLGSSSHESGYGVAVNGDGNVYISGDSSATWGNPVRAHAGDGDAFAAKLDSDGNFTPSHESLDYFKISEGHGIKYHVTDDYNSLDCNVWAASQYAESGKPHDIDFVFTLVKSGEEGGYFRNSSLGGEVSRNVDGKNLTLLYAGFPSGNQANFYLNFSLPRFFDSGDAWTIGNREHGVEHIGAYTVNGAYFGDCIRVAIDDSSNTADYLRGVGYFVLARDVGIVELVFDRANGDSVLYEYVEHGSLTRHTLSGTVCADSVPVEGIVVQLSNANWGTRSVTDSSGTFSIQAYGPDVILRVGYDEDGDDVFEFDDSYPRRHCVNNITSDIAGLCLDLRPSITQAWTSATVRGPEISEFPAGTESVCVNYDYDNLAGSVQKIIWYDGEHNQKGVAEHTTEHESGTGTWTLRHSDIFGAGGDFSADLFIDDILLASVSWSVGVEPIALDVPFLTQYPPGTAFSESMNCGQASSLMIFSYWDNTSPEVEGIIAIDEWLNSRFGDPINDYNGWYTDRTRLETLAREYAQWPYSQAANGWTLDQVELELARGHPVIVAVAGVLNGYYWEDSETPSWQPIERDYSENGHWLVATGFEDGYVVCNDPGTAYGHGIRYDSADFDTAMWGWEDSSGWDGSVVVVIPSPVASFDHSPDNPGLSQEVAFSAALSHDPDGQLVSYQWDFGDGCTGSGIQVNHSYSTPYDYVATMTVTDDDGNHDSTMKVLPLPTLQGGWFTMPSRGTPRLDTANMSDDDMERIYEVIRLALDIDEARLRLLGEENAIDQSAVDRLLNQIHPDKQDPRLVTTDIVKDNALSLEDELFIEFVTGVTQAGLIRIGLVVPGLQWVTLVGQWFDVLAEGAEMLGLQLGEQKTLGDMGSVTVAVPGLGRMEVVWLRPPEDRVIVNLYLQETSHRGGMIIAVGEWRDRFTLKWEENACSTLPVWNDFEFPPANSLADPESLIEHVHIVRMHSPGGITVHDTEGRMTGVVDGDTLEEIPGSVYDDELETVIVFAPSVPPSEYEVVGACDGDYGLGVMCVEHGDSTPLRVTRVPIAADVRHQYLVDWSALTQGGQAVTINVDSNADGEFEETIVTAPPNTPSNPSPGDDTYVAPESVVLEWSGGDPDGEDTVTYDVYFGMAEDPPLVSESQSDTTYAPSIQENTDYHWKVIARDNHGLTSEGPTWDFRALSACFIATAAYGTPTAQEIDILRDFRDEVLLPSKLGADFVSLYYQCSPPIAEFISRHEVLRTIVREGFLDPLVAMVRNSQCLWLGSRYNSTYEPDTLT